MSGLDWLVLGWLLIAVGFLVCECIHERRHTTKIETPQGKRRLP